ncbi:hypothetical protein [Marinomonas algarum]|uniref:Lipoprotein n=1 Tax=Marinomonas algarum TaxID=2883105 RepID=A0A9X1LBD6_9GAMM|nr:hypothetical protein [Marinomonas algarum]MCB5160709.1 hypothetical protein [Marinomonas algarum]
MPTLRTGFILASLLLGACTMPISQTAPNTKTEQAAAQNDDNLTNIILPSSPKEKETATAPTDEIDNIQAQNTGTEKNTVLPEKTVDDETSSLDEANSTDDSLLSKELEDHIQRATDNFVALKERTGNAPEFPDLIALSFSGKTDTETSLQELRTYISKTNTNLAVLDARVKERQDTALEGDIIRIFVTEATVKHGNESFKTQPLVGQWVRGESRTIRLKDNILFENPKSEELQIAFSETYQLIVNGQILSVINPKRDKNSANFRVSTENKNVITGRLDYRIVEKK